MAAGAGIGFEVGGRAGLPGIRATIGAEAEKGWARGTANSATLSAAWGLGGSTAANAQSFQSRWQAELEAMQPENTASENEDQPQAAASAPAERGIETGPVLKPRAATEFENASEAASSAAAGDTVKSATSDSQGTSSSQPMAAQAAPEADREPEAASSGAAGKADASHAARKRAQDADDASSPASGSAAAAPSGGDFAPGTAPTIFSAPAGLVTRTAGAAESAGGSVRSAWASAGEAKIGEASTGSGSGGARPRALPAGAAAASSGDRPVAIEARAGAGARATQAEAGNAALRPASADGAATRASAGAAGSAAQDEREDGAENNRAGTAPAGRGIQGLAETGGAQMNPGAVPMPPQNSSTIYSAGGPKKPADSRGTAESGQITAAAQPQMAAAAPSATGSSAGEAGSTEAARGPLPSEAFTALDAEPGSGAVSWTHAGPRQAEAGFEDPALGWVGVRADLSGGGVHAVILPASAQAAQALSGHLAGAGAHLAAQHIPVASLSMAQDGLEQGAMQPGAGQQGRQQQQTEPQGSFSGAARPDGETGAQAPAAEAGPMDPNGLALPGTLISVMA